MEATRCGEDASTDQLQYVQGLPLGLVDGTDLGVCSLVSGCSVSQAVQQLARLPGFRRRFRQGRDLLRLFVLARASVARGGLHPEEQEGFPDS